MNDNLKKNYILFLVLSTLVIFGYSYFFYKPEKKENISQEKKNNLEQVIDTKIEEIDEINDIEEIQIKTDNLESEVIEAANNYSSKIITVETKKYIAKIDTLGGKIVELKLNDFNQTTDENSPLVKTIDNSKKSFYSILKIQDVNIPPQIPYNYNGNSNIFVDSDSFDLNLLWKDKSGIDVKKTIKFYNSEYFIDESFVVENNSSKPVDGKLYISWLNNVKESSDTSSNYKFVSMVDNNVDRIKKSPKESESFIGEIKWFGFSGKYFINAFLPEIGGNLTLKVEPTDKKGYVKSTFSYPKEQISAGNSSITNWKVYLGPKNKKDLMSAGYGLEESIDYGYAGVLTKVAVGVLKFVNKYIKNYGISIILTTIVLRLIFLPLTVKSMKSMKQVQIKMQALKPKIDALKEKYKDDRQTQQTEMMKLYSSNGVNPLSSLGGCLPLLLQFPVFIALYFALLYSIDLRHTPFLWIADLAEPEHLFDIAGIPFRILPLLMGVSWFFSQKLTPTTAPGSETMQLQMKMMQFMPIIFTVMFWGLPSGLILYWTVSNIISIGQQLYINRETTAQTGG